MERVWSSSLFYSWAHQPVNIGRASSFMYSTLQLDKQGNTRGASSSTIVTQVDTRGQRGF